MILVLFLIVITLIYLLNGYKTKELFEEKRDMDSVLKDSNLSLTSEKKN